MGETITDHPLALHQSKAAFRKQPEPFGKHLGPLVQIWVNFIPYPLNIEQVVCRDRPPTASSLVSA